jgi:hypothetical protein
MQKRLASMPSESGEFPLFEVYKRRCDICLQLYEKELLTEVIYIFVDYKMETSIKSIILLLLGYMKGRIG